MTKLYEFVLVPLVLTLTAATAWGQTSGEPETAVVHSGPATLHAMLWRPQGRGPFRGILLNHGSGRTREDLERLGPYEQNAEKLGPVFARHGYVFLRFGGFPNTAFEKLPAHLVRGDLRTCCNRPGVQDDRLPDAAGPG